MPDKIQKNGALAFIDAVPMSDTDGDEVPTTQTYRLGTIETTCPCAVFCDGNELRKEAHDMTDEYVMGLHEQYHLDQVIDEMTLVEGDDVPPGTINRRRMSSPSSNQSSII